MNFKNLILLLILVAGGYYFYTNQSTEQPGLATRTKYEPANTQPAPREYEARDADPAVRITTVEEATIKLFQEAAPSVVFINTSKVRRDYWTRNIMEIPSGSGSGFVWDIAGHIVTNFHVIQGASKITVTLSNQESYDAILVGTEPDKDLAVLKLAQAPSDLRPIKVGSSSDLQVGQSVYAIGNPFGLDQSLTTGIISALGREIKSVTGRSIKEVIQTDAAINPGNSGGPLLDSSGRLIGVNTMIYSPSGASAGIGFSIPVDEVNWTITDLLNQTKRPIIGITLVPAQYLNNTSIKGAVVLEVSDNSPAARAGLQPTSRASNGGIQWGDVITAIDNKRVESNNDLIEVLENYEVGDEVVATISRNGKSITKKIVLAAAN